MALLGREVTADRLRKVLARISKKQSTPPLFTIARVASCKEGRPLRYHVMFNDFAEEKLNPVDYRVTDIEDGDLDTLLDILWCGLQTDMSAEERNKLSCSIAQQLAEASLVVLHFEQSTLLSV